MFHSCDLKHVGHLHNMDTLIGVLQKIRYSKGFLTAMYGVQEPIRNLKIILKYFNSTTGAFRVNKVFVYKMYNCHGSVCPSPSPSTTQALTCSPEP